MKTQLSKPARDRASYTEEYKREALELWRNSGRSAAKVAAELGIRPPLLYRWAHLERESKTAKSSPKAKRTIEELEAEIRRLRTENAKLLEQRRGNRGSELTIDTRGRFVRRWSSCRDHYGSSMRGRATT